ncbi:MAG: four helix bundle protein [Gemmatimonadaceae bacterium]
MQDFRKLKVWNKAHAFVLDVYSITKGFPSVERFGLTAQLRRSAASIATNLAEGCGRSSIGSFGALVQVAAGSACEADYQLLLARDIGYLREDSYNVLSKEVAEIQRMLAALHRTIALKAATRGR